jgi:hypothetical protein
LNSKPPYLFLLIYFPIKIFYGLLEGASVNIFCAILLSWPSHISTVIIIKRSIGLMHHHYTRILWVLGWKAHKRRSIIHSRSSCFTIIYLCRPGFPAIEKSLKQFDPVLFTTH